MSEKSTFKGHHGWTVQQFVPRRYGVGRIVKEGRSGYLVETYTQQLTGEDQVDRIIMTTATLASIPLGGQIVTIQTYGHALILHKHDEVNVPATRALVEATHANGMTRFRQKLGFLKTINEQLQQEVGHE